MIDALITELGFLATLFLPLFLQLVILFFVARGLWQLSMKAGGRAIWVILSLVGVPMHELSHAIAFWITGAGVQKLVLFAPRGLPEHGGATGVVVPRRKPSFLSSLVASIAPFFGCSIVALLVLWILLPGFSPSRGLSEVSGPLSVLSAYAGSMVDLLLNLDWGSWRTYLAIYLAASLGMGAAPSREDFKHFLPAFALMLMVLLPLLVLIRVVGAVGIVTGIQQLVAAFTLAIGTALLYATLFGLIALVVLMVLGAIRMSFRRIR